MRSAPTKNGPYTYLCPRCCAFGVPSDARLPCQRRVNGQLCGGELRSSRRPLAERNALVEQNRGLVGSVLKRLPRHLIMALGGYEDAEQVGLLGLIRACELFDESLGWKFSTYARYAVLHKLLPAVEKAGVIQLPVNPNDITPESQERAQKARNLQPLPGERCSWHPTVRREPEQDPRVPLLQSCFRDLSQAEWHLLWQYYWQDRTLEQIGIELRLSKERIRQKKAKVLDKLRQRIEAVQAPAPG